MRFDLAALGAALTPDRPAIWFNGRWYSYAELDERAARLANQLADVGIAPGERIGILADNHLAHFDLLYAAPKHGFVLVPFNPRLSAAELRTQCRIARPAVMFSDSIYTALAAEAYDGPQWNLADYRDWLARARRDPVESPPCGAESTQMLLFTGGSTGRAKAALIPYRQILANARGTAIAWDLGADDCAIQATPCHHAGVHVLSTPLLAVGGRVVLMNLFNPEDYLRLAQLFHCTLMFMVPSMYRQLADSPALPVAQLDTLRWAITGGAPCPPALSERLAAHGIRLKQGYGLTEAGVNCFAMDIDEAQAHPESVGYPMPHVAAEIRRAEGTRCASGEIGELTLSGEAVCSGYFESPEEWNGVFRDGWLWTGDLALRDARGRHQIRGRRKELYISGGENVFPMEVEAALTRCTGVAECAVLGVPDERWGETGLAAVVLRPGASAEIPGLRDELRLHLAGFKLPRHFLFYAALPKTGAGKIDKRAIRQRYESESAPA